MLIHLYVHTHICMYIYVCIYIMVCSIGPYRPVTNGRRAPAATPFNEPFVAHTCLYSCLAACFLLVLGHFACKYVSSNKLQCYEATAHRTEQNSPKTAQISPVFACHGLARRTVSSQQNVSHLRPLEPPRWHRAGWGFDYIPGVELSFASLHVTFTGTCVRARDQVSGCLWACSCSFILESLVFLPLPLFSCAHKVFVELLVKLPLFRETSELVHLSFFRTNQLSLLYVLRDLREVTK